MNQHSKTGLNDTKKETPFTNDYFSSCLRGIESKQQYTFCGPFQVRNVALQIPQC